ncbi:MAG: hypothetical protein KDB22_29695 [Planctomycetales bacterium]|nr:hypothetical protein [Planctomycetales bacterium]
MIKTSFFKHAITTVFIVVVTASKSIAADHADAPLLGAIGRSDAQITDFYAFTHGDDLVLALCTNPAVPPDVSTYHFAPDLTVDFHIDHRARVHRNDPLDLVRFGGTIVRPQSITENVGFRVQFDENSVPVLHTKGVSGKHHRNIKLYAGLRDDPFIRRPRAGRNVAAIVLQLPLEAVLGPRDDLLIWATTEIPEFEGPIADHAGRALRSMFEDPMNALSPRDQWRILEIVPDVLILNVVQPTTFPNGRLLTDDVVDLMVDIPLPGGTLPGEEPDFPATNDVPFLPVFPYLAPPHLVSPVEPVP